MGAVARRIGVPNKCGGANKHLPRRCHSATPNRHSVTFYRHSGESRNLWLLVSLPYQRITAPDSGFRRNDGKGFQNDGWGTLERRLGEMPAAQRFMSLP